ncbi:MAG: tetratricopeptide repeat protein [Deltaproteobacteria bacterium]|nr:tetratricopeptide repeat protein [Deltaproteobacteria bacterium]
MKKPNPSTLFLLFLSFLFMLSFWSCAGKPASPLYVKDGKEYGKVRGTFRHRWWNYYERALSYAEGEFYKEAIEDLKESIRQRAEDQRMARTYGMHFIDYFPHRELGVTYYHLGRYEDAKEELETSLSTADTGKAKFYLNMTRKVLIETSKADTAPPTINVTSVSRGDITNSFKLKVQGEVEDDSYAHTIAINEVPVFIELSAKKLPFSKEIRLKKGLNEIKIKTSDLLGKVTEKSVKVFADH